MRATVDFNAFVLYCVAAFAGVMALILIDVPMGIAPPEWLEYLTIGLVAIAMVRSISALQKRLDEGEVERIQFQQRMWKELLEASDSRAIFARRKDNTSESESESVHRSRRKESTHKPPHPTAISR